MASKAIGFLNFKFGADLKGFERAMNKAQKKLKKFGKNVTKAGQNLSRNLTLPILALGAASIKAFDQQAKAETKLLTALKGREDIQKRLITQAKELQEVSLFGDEVTIEAQAMLAMFGLNEEQIIMLIPLIQDMAQGIGMDLVGATSLVAKSVSTSTDALKRYFETGLNPTMTVQEKTIALTNSLSKAFKDQAYQASEVGAGPLVKMWNQLGDLSEEIGKRLMPYVLKLVGVIKGLIKKFDDLTETQKDNIVKWGLILAAIGPVLIIIGKISIGIAALIPLFTKLGTFLLANPWLIAAAAIAAVAYAIYDMTSAMNYQIDVEKEMGQLRVQAEKSIAKDLVNIEKLTGAIKDETTSLDDKLIALNTLKKTYPGYYDAIDETTLSTQYLDAATETLTTNLMKVATLTAYEDKLVEIRKKMLDLENTKDIDFSTKFYSPATSVITKLFGPGAGIISGVITKADELQATIQKDIDLNEYEQLEKLLKKLSGETVKLEKEVDKINKTFKKLDHNTKKVVKGEGEIVVETEKHTKALVPLIDKIKEYADIQKRQSGVFDLASYKKHLEDISKMWQDGGILAGPENMLNWTKKLTKAQEAHNATMELMEDIMFNAAMSAANSQEKFFKSFIENIKQAIKQLLIQLAVLTVIALLLGGGTIAIGEAFNIAKGKVLGLEGFADGGLVYGPTTALIGEGVGTTASNPEVVAPLDKLKQHMGGGNQNIIVEGVLKGNDIYLSNKNTSVNRLRTT